MEDGVEVAGMLGHPCVGKGSRQSRFAPGGHQEAPEACTMHTSPSGIHEVDEAPRALNMQLQADPAPSVAPVLNKLRRFWKSLFSKQQALHQQLQGHPQRQQPQPQRQQTQPQLPASDSHAQLHQLTRVSRSHASAKWHGRGSSATGCPWLHDTRHGSLTSHGSESGTSTDAAWHDAARHEAELYSQFEQSLLMRSSGGVSGGGGATNASVPEAHAHSCSELCSSELSGSVMGLQQPTGVARRQSPSLLSTWEQLSARRLERHNSTSTRSGSLPITSRPTGGCHGAPISPSPFPHTHSAGSPSSSRANRAIVGPRLATCRSLHYINNDGSKVHVVRHSSSEHNLDGHRAHGGTPPRPRRSQVAEAEPRGASAPAHSDAGGDDAVLARMRGSTSGTSHHTGSRLGELQSLLRARATVGVSGGGVARAHCDRPSLPLPPPSACGA
ncbi:hypothetical protein FOA52_015861 [Chlamydomonas sp. UWO 241]|nr:hypothetical protein FOA52_015861 [Chlamydomonas sp. UWO 241]